MIERMQYLDGLTAHIYDDDDIPDGAWFQMLVDTIGSHEETIEFFKWKEGED